MSFPFSLACQFLLLILHALTKEKEIKKEN